MKLDDFNQLAGIATAETPPKLNVADRVLATLNTIVPAKASVETEYALFGFGSLAAACVALILFSMSTGDDLLILFAEPFITVSP
jgi:hypothetical protein